MRALKDKLRIMSVPVLDPSYIYGDNMSVVHYAFSQESALKKKSYFICNYIIHELVTMGESQVGHLASSENIADPMTKSISVQKRQYVVSNILYDKGGH